jgi:hypothetical protein
VSYFSDGKSVRQFATFATHSTTKSPQKNHVWTPVFLKNPCKNANPPQQKKWRRIRLLNCDAQQKIA